MPWIDDTMHVTLGRGAEGMTEEQVREAAQDWRNAAIIHREQSDRATALLSGLPYAAVPLDQLADIYKRFLRLTRLGQGTIEEWDSRPKTECEVRHAVFNLADFGAVYSGQWLPKDLREEVRNLVKGKRYDHNFDQHEVVYHRAMMDGIIQQNKATKTEA